MSREPARGVEAVRLASEVASKLSGLVSASRAYRVLKTITQYHRIQGSPGLLEAASRVEELIIDWAPDIVETELIVYSGKQGPEWLPLPAEWRLEDARLIVGGRELRSDHYPTLAAAHSPPSDGWVEGIVARPAGDPLDPESYSDPDRVYLITESWSLAYRVAAEQGVKAVILAKEKAYPDATPYIGLFLSPEEAQRYNTPAVTVPWSIARGLEGKTVRLRVDATLGGPGRLPVLAAWIGDKNAPGPVIMGHLCHPMPGANDNASGASASVEAFIALAEAVDQGVLEEPPATVRLVLMPEWTGTVLSMEGWLGPLAAAGVNLDMVGSRVTGPASIYYPPGVAPEHRLADTMAWVSSVAGLGIGLRYYMFGSDHDVFQAYGRESEIVNQWPDPYYHSSHDDADKISPDRLARAALLGAASAYLYARGAEPPATPAVRVVEGIVASHAGRGDTIAAKLAGYYLASRYGIAPLARLPGDWRPPAGGERLRLRGGVRLLTGLGVARILGLDAAVRFEKALRGWDAGANIVRGELVIGAARGLPLGGLLTLVAAAYGVENMRKTVQVLGELEEAGLVETG